ncbi:MAG: nucleotidyltransferase family protein [Alphaproteobacteria bacterium]|nr:nucleotidyltransferase family protein [Alphaproteobacteria bacterium]MDE2340373.1 nucleotidyltransferase family protein [Alphaproteobacteria bacterium]
MRNDGPDIYIALLCAGAGARFGGDKMAATLEDKPLLTWSLEAARALGAPIMIITAPDHRPVLDGNRQEVEWHINTDAASGMASSLILAARHAQARKTERLLVMLGDMPFVSSATLRRLVAQTRSDSIVACRYPDTKLGPPACFGAVRLSVLLSLSGDTGARAVLNQPGMACGLDVTSEELFDIDTVADLAEAGQRQAAARHAGRMRV